MFDEIISKLLEYKAVKAIKYTSEKAILRAARTTFGKKFLRGNVEITLTLGKPNFLERKFIKKCLKEGETFPFMQFKYLPTTRKLVSKRNKKRRIIRA